MADSLKIYDFTSYKGLPIGSTDVVFDGDISVVLSPFGIVLMKGDSERHLIWDKDELEVIFYGSSFAWYRNQCIQYSLNFLITLKMLDMLSNSGM